MNRLYAYLYDDYLSDPAFVKAIANIETRCSALGIQGRTARLAIFRSAKELVEGLVKDGAQTIVVVGNDRTLEKVMWFLPDLPVTIGYIPVSEPHGIAGLLGIPFGDLACDILAARRIETLDVGRVDDRYFLTDVRIPDARAQVDVEGRYRIGPSSAGTICIRNLGGVSAQGIALADAKDGLLELTVEPIAMETPSRFLFWKKHHKRDETSTRLLLTYGRIESREPVDVFVDNHVMSGFSFSFGIEKDRIKVITGRGKKL
jgi:hypothetical protein